MLTFNTGDPQSERLAGARLILQKVGEAFQSQPEEYVSQLTVCGVSFGIHGVADDEANDGQFDVLVMELYDLDALAQAAEDATSLSLFREDPEDGALMYSRVKDTDCTPPSEEALLIRAAMEEVLGIAGLPGIEEEITDA